MKKAFVAVATLALLQTACSTAPQANPRFTIGKPYSQNGKTYFPTIQPDYKEIGMASWYGPGFHNRLTANGEVFNQNLMTAAHRTLPLPSIVKVTNLENGRSAYLRVNDRGPFSKNRVIDLSKQAAASLGFMGKGQAKVLIEIDKNSSATALNSVKISEAEKKSVLSQLQVAPAEETALNSVTSQTQQGNQQSFTEDRDTSPNPISIAKVEEIKSKNTAQAKNQVADLSGEVLPQSLVFKNAFEGKTSSVKVTPTESKKLEETSKSQSDEFFVQVHASKTLNEAEKAAKKLNNKFSSKIEEADVNGTKFFRVRLGGFKTKQDALKAQSSIKNIGYNDAFIVSPN